MAVEGATHPHSHVYILRHRSEPRIKIGKANSLDGRLRRLDWPALDLERSMGLQVRSEEDAFRVERILHRAFEKWRLPAQANVRGGGRTEWFDAMCIDRSMAFIKESADVLGVSIVAVERMLLEGPRVSDRTTTTTRRNNALLLFRQFAEHRIAAGAASKGLEQEFAAALQMSPSTWCQMKSSRPIGDKLARQIEANSSKPHGWLDEVHEADAGPTPAEQQFLASALAAYRGTNSDGRRQLRQLINTWGQRTT